MMKRLTAAAVAATLGFFAIGPAPAKADDPYWQCVTFARMFSGINIFGDAWTGGVRRSTSSAPAAPRKPARCWSSSPRAAWTRATSPSFPTS